jgi:hypothetical protein
VTRFNFSAWSSNKLNLPQATPTHSTKTNRHVGLFAVDERPKNLCNKFNALSAKMDIPFKKMLLGKSIKILPLASPNLSFELYKNKR